MIFARCQARFNVQTDSEKLADRIKNEIGRDLAGLTTQQFEGNEQEQDPHWQEDS